MTLAKLKADFVAVVDRELKDGAAPVVYGRILNKIEALEDDPDAVKRTISNIAIVVRLLVDEDLSDDIAEVLQSVARSSGYEIGR
ncbi:MAG: hypothetical protein QNJ97_04550 [Myxococcota bacterium]|nr:hypothetical protein [Myxococcota bacterium]